MKLSLHQSSVYLNIFYLNKMLHDPNFFSRMCNELKNFPLKSHYSNIIGLSFSGNYFKKTILFSDVDEVRLPPDELKKIERITPIMEKMEAIPYIIDHDYFEICIPAKNKSVKDLLNHITIMDKTFSRLIEKHVQWKKIEIHIKGGWEKNLICEIGNQALPLLHSPHSPIKIHTKDRHIDKEIFPINKQTLSEIVNMRSVLKLINKNNKVILKAIAKMQLGLSIYSNQVDWFVNTLEKFDESHLFQQPIQTKIYSALPHMAAF